MIPFSRALGLAALCLLPLHLTAQTPVLRKVQTRAIVRDSACAGEPAGWRARDTTFRTMTEATTLSRTRIACPVVPPPPPPPDTITPPPTPPPVTLGVWTNVTPAGVNLTTDLPCGNFGVASVAVDPTRPSDVYAAFNCQGIWRSTNYGATWTGPIDPPTTQNCTGDLSIGGNGVIHLSCIRGAVGYWRSTDRGASWTRYTIAPVPGDRQDMNAPVVDPSDPNHLVMTGHEQDVMVESVNGGLTWTSLPVPPGVRTGGSPRINFVKTGNPATTRTTLLWISDASDQHGTWRTTNLGTSWVQVDRNEHMHGNSEIYQPDASGVIYMAGVYSRLGWGVLRSADYGVTWARVNGADGSMRVVTGTANRLFAGASYPNSLTGSFGPWLWTAPTPGTGPWTALPPPAGMFQGPHQAAVTSDGTRSYIITANFGAGLWRYVELGATVLVPPVAVPPTPAPPPVVTPPVVVPPPVVTPPTGGTNGVPFDPGVSVALVRSNPVLPSVINYEGNFRTVCFAGKVGVFDPIVYPGLATAGHEHLFLGNIGISGFSTPESLRTSGNSNCFGGIANRTGYWMPTIRDAVTGELQIPERAHIYYKSAYLDPRTITVIPQGLRMIAGDKNNTTGRQEHAEWYCSRTYIPNTDGFIPNCPAGEQLMVSIAFPECWNGRDLDSPDHQSHMAYNLHRNPGPSVCPSTHPIPLPRIEEIFIFPVKVGAQPLRWRLSSDMYSTAIRGGRSVHADWMNGWDQAILTTLTRSCINATRDCTVDLGDGRQLYRE